MLTAIAVCVLVVPIPREGNDLAPLTTCAYPTCNRPPAWSLPAGATRRNPHEPLALCVDCLERMLAWIARDDGEYPRHKAEKAAERMFPTTAVDDVEAAQRALSAALARLRREGGAS